MDVDSEILLGKDKLSRFAPGFYQVFHYGFLKTGWLLIAACFDFSACFYAENWRFNSCEDIFGKYQFYDEKWSQEITVLLVYFSGVNITVTNLVFEICDKTNKVSS